MLGREGGGRRRKGAEEGEEGYDKTGGRSEAAGWRGVIREVEKRRGKKGQISKTSKRKRGGEGKEEGGR